MLYEEMGNLSNMAAMTSHAEVYDVRNQELYDVIKTHSCHSDIHCTNWEKDFVQLFTMLFHVDKHINGMVIFLEHAIM